MLPLWLTIAAVLLVILLILFRTMNQVYLLSLIKKHFFWFFAVAAFVIFAFVVAKFYTTYDVDFTTFEGLSTTARVFFVWIQNAFSNFIQITGFAAEQSWLPDPTNVTKIK